MIFIKELLDVHNLLQVSNNINVVKNYLLGNVEQPRYVGHHRDFSTGESQIT